MTAAPSPVDAAEQRTRELVVLLGTVREEDRARLLEQLITVNLPFARRVARRYEGRAVPTEDLHQVACLGLVHAAHRFDPQRGNFYAFATVTISGEIKRYFRDTGWAVRPPRPIQELSPALTTAAEALTHELGRSPTPREVADRLDVDVEQVVETLVGRQGHQAESLDAPRSMGSSSGSSSGLSSRWADVLPAEDSLHATIVDRVVLRQALSTLPPPERRILALRFFAGLTQDEIGHEVGVTQAQVSRMISRTLDRLRQQMTDAPDERPRNPSTP